MMRIKAKEQRGFTLIEIMVVVAIVGVLSAVAVIGYQEYVARARAAEVLVKYDELRTRTLVRLSGASVQKCDDVASALNKRRPVSSEHVMLGYGFEAAAGGYRPVLTVCAQTDPIYPFAVKVARAAHDAMAKAGFVEQKPVLTDSLVSFALRLTSGDRAICKQAVTTPIDSCKLPIAAAQASAGATPAPAGASGAGTQAANTAPPATGSSTPAPRPGQQCLVCGDRDAQMPCSDMDLVLAVMSQCPDSTPYCRNNIVTSSGGDVQQFRMCTDEGTAISKRQASQKNPLCSRASLDAAIDQSAPIDADCDLVCYGDRCNIETQFVDQSKAVTIENGKLLVGGRP